MKEIKEHFFSKNLQLLFLVLLALLLNVNTLFNEYALDDEEVLTKNTLVQKGISGIPEILTSDLMAGTPDAKNALMQARYRPISLLIFAVEYQFFGANPMISHLINILLFAVLIAILFRFLYQHLFREQKEYFAFISCLIFIVHPIHCEVIANVKSRDELLCFLFILSSFICMFHYFEKHSKLLFTGSLVLFLLALLTRESAVTALAIFPLILFFFFQQSMKKSLLFSMPFLAVFVLYLIVRINIVGFSHPAVGSILDSPFLYASAGQAFATKLVIILKYMCLLLFPSPLSCDYGYNQIPYIEITSFYFVLSALVILVLIGIAVYYAKSKSRLSFSLFYFFISISIATNFIVDIGTPMSERLLFQASLGFCILLGIAYFELKKRQNVLANISLVMVLTLFSVKTISRNREWRNNQSLFFTDVISAPNSLRTNLYAAVNYVKKANAEKNSPQRNQDYGKAILYGERAKALLNKYPETYIALGFAYFGLHNNSKAGENWMIAKQFDPNNPIVLQSLDMLSNIYFKRGHEQYSLGRIADAILDYERAIDLNQNNIEAWYQLGGIYFLLNDTKKGIEAWQNVLNMSPNHPLVKEDFHCY